MVEIGNAATGILEAHADVRIIVVYPTYQVSPSSYKSDLVQLKVRDKLVLMFEMTLL